MSLRRKIIFKKKKNNFLELSYENKHNLKSSSINFKLVDEIINLINLNKQGEIIKETNFDIPIKKNVKKTTDFYIDTESFVKENIGGKTIYFDYEKNIIYDENIKIIGNICEDELVFNDITYDSTINDLENNINLNC